MSKLHKARAVLLVVGLVFSVWLFSPSGSTLLVHAPPGEKAQIDFRPHLLGYPLVFTNSRGEIRVFPVHYGKHRLQVVLSDGQICWVTFFNSDVGRRKQIDIFIYHEPNTRNLRFKEVINSKTVVFDALIDASATSNEKPALLGWI